MPQPAASFCHSIFCHAVDLSLVGLLPVDLGCFDHGAEDFGSDDLGPEDINGLLSRLSSECGPADIGHENLVPDQTLDLLNSPLLMTTLFTSPMLTKFPPSLVFPILVTSKETLHNSPPCSHGHVISEDHERFYLITF
jgi:hypothetical protein